MLSHQSDCSGKVNCVMRVIINSQLANFLAAKQTLLVADNVINTYNYSDLLTAICKHAPVFVVKVSRRESLVNCPYKTCSNTHPNWGVR